MNFVVRAYSSPKNAIAGEECASRRENSDAQNGTMMEEGRRKAVAGGQRSAGAIVRRCLVRPNRRAFQPGTILLIQRRERRLRRRLLRAAWALASTRHTRGRRTHKKGQGERGVLKRAADVRFHCRYLPRGTNRRRECQGGADAPQRNQHHCRRDESGLHSKPVCLL